MSIPRKYKDKQCSVDNCKRFGILYKNGRRYLTKGYCNVHYLRLKRTGKLELEIKKHEVTKPCIVKDCSALRKANGFCSKHLHRHYRKQDMHAASRFDSREAIVVDDIAKIPLGVSAKDGYAIVDASYSWLDKYKWHSTDGYAAAFIDGRIQLLHRYIMGSESEFYDHINRNRRDNRKRNLRSVTRLENNRNITPMKISSSDYPGVRLVKGKYSVNISGIHLGTIEDIEEALSLRLHGESIFWN